MQYGINIASIYFISISSVSDFISISSVSGGKDYKFPERNDKKKIREARCKDLIEWLNACYYVSMRIVWIFG